MEEFSGMKTPIPVTGIGVSKAVAGCKPGNSAQSRNGAQSAGNTGFSSALLKILPGPGAGLLQGTGMHGDTPVKSVEPFQAIQGPAGTDIPGQGLPPHGNNMRIHVVSGSMPVRIDPGLVTSTQEHGGHQSVQRMHETRPGNIRSKQDRVTVARQVDQFRNLVHTNNVTGLHPESEPVKVSRINQPLSHREWSEALGNRVIFVSRQLLKYASIRINPGQLGPITVRISIQSDQALVRLTANHPAVREAIESAIPRLKEMFEEIGYQSVDVDVSSQQDNHGLAQGEQNRPVTSHLGSEHLDQDDMNGHIDTDSHQGSQRITLGMIDYFV